ncbi:MAG: NAD-dependent epimerase/dehydratase family protein [Clostridiales bacterium]|jgi:dihydroflavonol-4-reductase|nr:NAD-dependent epimerase/dehydratase family protein [Clostridiales bacterium]
MSNEIHVVTGAAGRIGFPLVLELKKRGAYVRAFCHSDNEISARLKEIADEVVFGDLRVPKDVEAAFTGATYVYHLGGLISIGSKLTAELRTVNVEGTRNVVNACVKRQVKRLVHTGSVHALDFENKTDVLTEPDRYAPSKVKGPYAATKAEACNLVLDAVKQHGLNAVIALPSGVTGAYEYKLSNFGQMIRDVANKKLPVYISGEYDFVDAEDVAWALAELALKGVKGESYLVSGHKITVKELVGLAAGAAGVKPPKIKIPTFLVKMVAPMAESGARRKGKLPTFTPYSIKVLHDNCNFSHEKLTALTGYDPRPVAESIQAQVDFLKGLQGGAKVESAEAESAAVEGAEVAGSENDSPWAASAEAESVEAAGLSASAEASGSEAESAEVGGSEVASSETESPWAASAESESVEASGSSESAEVSGSETESAEAVSPEAVESVEQESSEPVEN